jgi:hypothetical protein
MFKDTCKPYLAEVIINNEVQQRITYAESLEAAINYFTWKYKDAFIQCVEY